MIIGPAGFMRAPKTEQDLNMTGAEFKAALKRIGWTQGDFAKRYGLNKSTTSDWATGKIPVQSWAVRVLLDIEAENKSAIP